jgi:ankyrin repeat protein
MFQTVRKGDVEAVERLLARDATLAQGTDISGNTPLHVAALADWKPGSQHAAIAMRLIQYGADVNARGYEENMEEMTPLLLAVFSNNVSVVKLLLSNGADPNGASGKGETPLGSAAAKGEEMICRLLLARGARPDVHSGARLGLNDYLEALLDVDPHLLEEESTYDDLTPLECAAWHGQSRTAKLLINRGASVNIFVAAGLQMNEWMESFIEAKPSLAHSRPGTERNRRTGAQPLTWAARNGQTEAMDILFTQHVDVSARDWWGANALHHAATRGATLSIEPLVRAGVMPDAEVGGRTAWEIAVAEGHQETADAIQALTAKV